MERKRKGNLGFQTSLRLDPELRAQLKALAEKRGQYQSEVLRDAIKVLACQSQQRESAT